MDEGRFWLSMVLGGLAIIAGAISVATWNVNTSYARAQSECIAAGNSWVPTSGYNAICLKQR